MAADTGQRPINEISRRTVLRAGVLAGAGMVMVGATSAVLTGTAQASTPSPQPGWGWCEFCSTMWWTAGQSNSACAAPEQGVHGARRGSYNYDQYNSLSGASNTTNPQANWRWCIDCQGLFWAPSGNQFCEGRSFGQPHVAGSGTNYDLFFNKTQGDTSDPQPYWRWCSNCGLLYWQGPSGKVAGYCPIGGFHIAGSATSYCIYWSGTY